MRFGLKRLLAFVTVLCLIMGAYRFGYRDGRSVGRAEGYNYADVKYKYFLGEYATQRYPSGIWEHLGQWFCEGGVSIIRPFDETEYEWNMRRFSNRIGDDGHLESFPPRQPNSLGPEA